MSKKNIGALSVEMSEALYCSKKFRVKEMSELYKIAMADMAEECFINDMED